MLTIGRVRHPCVQPIRTEFNFEPAKRQRDERVLSACTYALSWPTHHDQYSQLNQITFAVRICA
jgi:hypothetical protein